MKSPQLVAVATLTILALVACGGSSTPSGAPSPATEPGGAATTPAPADGTTTTPAPAAGPVDLCALLSAADLKTATGDDYGDGVLDSAGQCIWRVGGTDFNEGDGQVVAFIQDVPLETFKDMFGGGVDLTVSGQAAYWNPDDGLKSMWVDVGGRTLVLSFDPVGDDGQAIAEKVAEIALAGM